MDHELQLAFLLHRRFKISKPLTVIAYLEWTKKMLSKPEIRAKLELDLIELESLNNGN